MPGSAIENGALERLSAKLRPAFIALLEAFRYAADTRSDRWEFAVAIRYLEKLGLNENDLRWLVRKGYVEHAREVTVQGVNGREFQPTGDLTFCKRTCFVLTETGVVRACSAVENQPPPPPNGFCVAEPSPATPSDVPHWDAETRELRIDGTILKQFKWHAANQEIILSTFQEEGWPFRIDDPLPPQSDQDPKRRLSDTIKCLNRKQANKLIRFRGDGTGEGIIWERVQQHDSAADAEC